MQVFSHILRVKTVNPVLRCLDLGEQGPNQTSCSIRELFAPCSSCIASVPMVSLSFLPRVRFLTAS
jgi:hypothetical protein